MDILRPANEAHTRHSETMAVERFLRRRDECRMIGQAEIVVGAEIDHAPAVGDWDLGVLRPGDDALGFEKSLRFDFIQGLRDVIGKFREHRAISSKDRSLSSRAERSEVEGSQCIASIAGPLGISAGSLDCARDDEMRSCRACE